MEMKTNTRILKAGFAAFTVAAAFACAGGTLTVKFNSAMEVEIDGETRTFAAGETFKPTAIPCLYRMRPVLAEGERTFGIVGNDYIRNDDKAVERLNCRFPLLDEGNWVRVALDPYPVEDKTVELSAIKATGVFYVDAENGNDEWDGTADYENRNEVEKIGPKKSLQASHDAATGDYPIVLAAPGTYNTGCATNEIDGVKCIRRLISTKKIGFIATAGSEETFVAGSPHSESVGRGVDAVSGVYMDVPDGACAFFQGFTITGCYSSASKDGVHMEHQYGAGFAGDGHRAYCLDCVISNNSSDFYSATCKGVIKRTKIYENSAYRKVARFGVFSSCVFAGNTISTGNGVSNNNPAFHDAACAYNCTYDLWNPNRTETRNQLFISGSEIRVSLVYGLGNNDTINQDLWHDSKAINDPHFANLDARDYRISIKSPAYNASSYSEDLDGIARSLLTGDVDGTMPVLHEGKISLGAVYSKKWHVAQNGGDDANDGKSSSSAKATIKAATDLAFSGDTVYVAPGTYADAEETQEAGSLGTRVVVPEDVTLESTGGAENTFIIGAAATGNQIDNATYGTGTNAVRCVYAKSGAVVRGFTLTGGRAIGVGKASGEDEKGAAFLSAEPLGATIEDCIISNNVACSSTVLDAVVRRCRVLENIGLRTDNISAVAGNNCSWYGTIISGNRGSGTVCNSKVVEGCTIANNLGLDGRSTQVMYWYTSEDRAMVNTAVLGGEYFFSGKPAGKLYCTNCYVVAGSKSINHIIKEEDYASQLYNTIVGESGSLAQVDADYRPIPGAVSLIDNGDTAYVEASVGGVDVLGNQRISNGKMDIGAVEYDWCPVFSSELGRRFTVAQTSPSVTTNASGGIVVSDGFVAGTVRSEGPYRLVIDMTGGSAEVYVGNVLAGECSGAGSHSIRFKVSDPADEIRIVFTPDEENSAPAVIKAVANARGFILGIR